MKQLFVLVFFLFSTLAIIAQNLPQYYSDSPNTLIRIGSNSSKSETNINVIPGSTIYGTSPKTFISIGLLGNIPSGNNSNPINLNVGQSQREESRSIDLNTEIKELENNNSPNYYALVIGVDKYQYSSANISNLDKPIKDASALNNLLISKYSFPNSNVTFLQNPTRAEILQEFEALAKKANAKDNILIFYAGHGYWDERLKVGYWLPADSKTNDKSSWIANSTIRDYIAGIQSKHTLLISDACFSGSIFKTREVNSEINEYGIAKIYQLPSRKAITSGTLTTVPDESKFMEYFLKRLNENESKYLTTRQLFYSFETAILNNTSTVPQFGVIQDTGDEGGDFIFIKK